MTYFLYTRHFTPTPKNKYSTAHAAGLQLLSQALAETYNIHISAEELPQHIAAGEHGKPYFTDYPTIHYNISHCEDFVVCALSDREIGVDVEEIRFFHTSVIRKVFTLEEQLFLEEKNLDEDSLREWFFRFWTLKECRVKHSGLGLTMKLTDFSFSFEGTKDPYQISCSDANLSFEQIKLEDRYIVSICI